MKNSVSECFDEYNCINELPNKRGRFKVEPEHLVMIHSFKGFFRRFYVTRLFLWVDFEGKSDLVFVKRIEYFSPSLGEKLEYFFIYLFICWWINVPSPPVRRSYESINN